MTGSVGDLQESLEDENLVSILINSSTDPSLTDLITITPAKVLRTKVLVRILGTLLQWRHMVPMLPMLIPQVPSIDRTKD